MYSPEGRAGAAPEPAPRIERRFALKHATDEAHTRVEAVVQSAGMFGSLKGYRQYVAATWAMRSRLEALLDRSGASEIWPEWAGRRIAGLAAQDMTDLGLELPLRREEFSAQRLTPPELLATLYVLEGSALGARILVRSVTALGLTSDFGARHLHAQAGDSGAWRSFLDVLETLPAPPCHETARAVFDQFADAYAQAHG